MANTSQKSQCKRRHNETKASNQLSEAQRKHKTIAKTKLHLIQERHEESSEDIVEVCLSSEDINQSDKNYGEILILQEFEIE